jgi:hypothetical protein
MSGIAADSRATISFSAARSASLTGESSALRSTENSVR